MTLEETLKRLKDLGDEKVRARNIRAGAGENQYGVKMGDIRKLAKQIKTNRALAFGLWETGNTDAQLLAILLVKPKMLSRQEVDHWVRTATVAQVADWLNAYIAKKHADAEPLRLAWMTADDVWAARAGWSLTATRVAKGADLDLSALLDRIEAEMAAASSAVQWTMNMALAEIGIASPDHRNRALAIGESLGVYRDYPVSKGCTSPFAPIWIAEIVRRRG